jgi:putative nucleotidyltransferase with HDIG domain
MQSVSQDELKANQQMDQIIGSLGDLPASPAVINRVMSMTADFNTDTTDLSKALSADQTLTAKILKLSNSSFYGRAQGVASLEEAVMILGFFTLRSLVIATATHSMFSDDGPDSHEHILWEHSLATGMASRIIAQHTGGADVEEAFIAGLMHDIGKLIFLQKMPEAYGEIIAKIKSEGSSFADLEKQMFGFSHAALGSILMIKWSFPQGLIDAIASHHDLEKIAKLDDCSLLPAIINLADSVAINIGTGFGQEPQENLAALESAQKLDLDDQTLNTILTDLRESFEQEKCLFAN